MPRFPVHSPPVSGEPREVIRVLAFFFCCYGVSAITGVSCPRLERWLLLYHCRGNAPNTIISRTELYLVVYLRMCRMSSKNRFARVSNPPPPPTGLGSRETAWWWR
ncbi:unnamed protein product, partial [Ectocarpus sp. 12 AP-2014]